MFEDCANGTLLVSDEMLFEAAQTITAANEVLNAVVFIEAVRTRMR